MPFGDWFDNNKGQLLKFIMLHSLLWASGALDMLGCVRYSWGEIGLSYRLRTPQQDFVHLEYCKGNCSYLGNILGYLGAKIGAPDPKCVSHSTLGLMRQTFGRNVFLRLQRHNFSRIEHM